MLDSIEVFLDISRSGGHIEVDGEGLGEEFLDKFDGGFLAEVGEVILIDGVGGDGDPVDLGDLLDFLAEVLSSFGGELFRVFDTELLELG